MAIIKRTKDSTREDLLKALAVLLPLLTDQNEGDAVTTLTSAGENLRQAELGSKAYIAAINEIMDAFEGDHELIAYTHLREGDQWTEAEQLSQASSRVLSLVRRLKISH
jgi:hypothetical protein